VSQRLPRWLKWLGGCLFLLLAAIAAVIGLFIYAVAPPPLRSAAVVSPDGKWRAWLQRPQGSMEPIFYTLRLQSRGIFGAHPVCNLAVISNWGVESTTRLSWPTAAVLQFDYGIAPRDKLRQGAPQPKPVPAGCAPVRLVTRHDPALDGATGRANVGNMHYGDSTYP
jgi:hypothetical protein